MLKYPSVVLLICSFLVALVQTVPEGRILSGEFALRSQFPHQIFMNRSRGYFCGGSIISRNYILTAAHCIFIHGYRVPTHMFTIIAGSNNINRGLRFKVADIIIHPLYKKPGIHDIALMQLAEPLTFSRDIRPIFLSRSDPPVGARVVISGYGAINNFKINAKELQWTYVYTLSTESCRSFIHFPILWHSVICLDHEIGSGACFGDSGGPVTFKEELIGVCSFGNNVCGSKVPDVYTRVLPYLDWIEEHSDYREFISYLFNEYT